MPAVSVVLHLANVDGSYPSTFDVPRDSLVGQAVEDVPLSGGLFHLKQLSGIGALEFSGSTTTDRTAGSRSDGHSDFPKNKPAPRPKTDGENAKSLFIISAANPTFVLSIKLTT